MLIQFVMQRWGPYRRIADSPVESSDSTHRNNSVVLTTSQSDETPNLKPVECGMATPPLLTTKTTATTLAW